MHTDYDLSFKNGYTIAKIHASIQSVLKESDYNTLQQCETLEDVIVKLYSTPYQKYLSGETINSKKEFKHQLNRSLVTEIININKNQDKDLGIIIDYLVEYYKIHNFVYLLAAKEHDPELERSFSKIEEIGNFKELLTLKVATDMSEVYKFCVEKTFLKDYYNRIKFQNDIKNNNWQIILSQFIKFLLEDTFAKINNSMPFMRNILRCEGDRRIIEIVMSTSDSKELVGRARKRLFPSVTSLDLGTIEKLSDCCLIDELRGHVAHHPMLRQIIGVEDEEIMNALVDQEMELFWSSFDCSNDLSCVYAYFKIKEQEIKNILLTVECISLKKKDFLKNLIVHHEHLE